MKNLDVMDANPVINKKHVIGGIYIPKLTQETGASSYRSVPDYNPLDEAGKIARYQGGFASD